MPITTEYIVWLADTAGVRAGWWQELQPLLDRRVDYIGRLGWLDYPAGAAEQLQTRPWYRGVPPERRDGRPGVAFMTGGFFVLRAACLREVSLSEPRAGGQDGAAERFEVFLGEAARQLGWTLATHDALVADTAD